MPVDEVGRLHVHIAISEGVRHVQRQGNYIPNWDAAVAMKACVSGCDADLGARRRPAPYALLGGHVAWAARGRPTWLHATPRGTAGSRLVAAGLALAAHAPAANVWPTLD